MLLRIPSAGTGLLAVTRLSLHLMACAGAPSTSCGGGAGKGVGSRPTPATTELTERGRPGAVTPAQRRRLPTATPARTCPSLPGMASHLVPQGVIEPPGTRPSPPVMASHLIPQGVIKPAGTRLSLPVMASHLIPQGVTKPAGTRPSPPVMARAGAPSMTCGRGAWKDGPRRPAAGPVAGTRL